MARKTCERDVEFAVGFVGGQWTEVTITLDEPLERVLDDDELVEMGEKKLQRIKFPNPVAFYHVLHIEDPEGGFGEDLNL